VLGRPSGRRWARALGQRPAASAIPTTCSARARAPRGRRALLASYHDAIDAIGKAAGNEPLPNRPGISVKLSALHPRYEAVSRERVMRELVPEAPRLAQAAKAHDLNFTVDAEEADRLELSLDVIAAVLADPSLAGWDGFGLAVQAYQKRALAVIDWLAALAARARPPADGAARQGRLLGHRGEAGAGARPPRLSGVHPQADDRPQLHGLRRRLLAARPRLYPQFATHNALTVATILERAGGTEGYEFQRLHGMGDALYERLLEDDPTASPAAPTRRSAAIATCSPISSAACWRTARTPPSSRARPIRRCPSRRC
jgi:RHH-type proline utilization regulon transcriptional repressor/proline dehydrogenase/delta 1-pyrroline-5-carboxylate dehydrogenase